MRASVLLIQPEYPLRKTNQKQGKSRGAQGRRKPTLTIVKNTTFNCGNLFKSFIRAPQLTVLLLSLDCRKSTHYECRVVVKIVFALKLCLKCRRVWSVDQGRGRVRR